MNYLVTQRTTVGELQVVLPLDKAVTMARVCLENGVPVSIDPTERPLGTVCDHPGLFARSEEHYAETGETTEHCLRCGRDVPIEDL